MPFDPNYVRAFQGLNLPQIDQARRQNALGNLDLQQQQQKVAGLMNPNATPEQLARSGNTAEATSVANIQQQRQQNAKQVVGNGYLAIAQSQNPIELLQQLAKNPSYNAAMQEIGIPPLSQVDNWSGITPDQLRATMADHAQMLGVGKDTLVPAGAALVGPAHPQRPS